MKLLVIVSIFVFSLPAFTKSSGRCSFSFFEQSDSPFNIGGYLDKQLYIYQSSLNEGRLSGSRTNVASFRVRTWKECFKKVKSSISQLRYWRYFTTMTRGNAWISDVGDAMEKAFDYNKLTAGAGMRERVDFTEYARPYPITTKTYVYWQFYPEWDIRQATREQWGYLNYRTITCKQQAAAYDQRLSKDCTKL